MDSSLPGSSVWYSCHGFWYSGILVMNSWYSGILVMDSPCKNTGVGLAIPFCKGSPDLGIEPWSPALQADSIPSEPAIKL